MSLDLGSKQQEYGVDVRDSAVHRIKDIEKINSTRAFWGPGKYW